MSNLNPIVAEALANVTRIGAEIEALQSEAKKRRLDALQPFLDALAVSGEVSVIVVRGYTPGFNDGEPCEHSADFWVNIKQLYDDDILEYGFEGFDTKPFGFMNELKNTRVWNSATRSYDEMPDALEKNRALCAAHGHVFDAPSPEIMDAIKHLVFSTVEESESTDYYVIFILKNGKFERFSGRYDCGY